MISGEAKLSDVLDVLEAIGRAATRLATLLKVEQELGTGDDLGEEFDQAIAELFGQRASFQPEGNGGAGGADQSPPA